MGYWKDDRFHGEGLYTYSNGEQYKGKFQEGKKKLFENYSKILKKYIDKSIEHSSAAAICYNEEN